LLADRSDRLNCSTNGTSPVRQAQGDRPVPSTLAIRTQGAATHAWAGGEGGRFALAARSS
jgi:hypothetical protein